MLRAAVKDKTELGVKAKEYMDAGQLVPDDLIINVVVERLKQPDCQKQGWLLDGFPRTRAQADALAKLGIEADAFILLDVPQEVLVERVTGRRTDPQTGKIYHMTFSPPSDPEVISRLVQRSDDTEEKIVVRYQEFCSHVDSVKECYTDRTVWVDGSISPEQVSQVIMGGLSELVTEADKLSSVGSGGSAGADVAARGSGSSSGSGFSSGRIGPGSSSALRMLKTAAEEDVTAEEKQISRQVHTHTLGMRQLTARSPMKFTRFAR
jgi:adenylate kinase